MKMTPISYYQQQNQNGAIVQDQEQYVALQHLEKAYHALIREQQKRSGFFSFFRKPQSVPGVYLWGGVGIGKTFLMDCFYHCLPFPQKLRLHFHQFMRLVHQELKQYQGREDPLQCFAQVLAKKTMVLCFDELVVSDIADAMILGRLFDRLFAQGVSLVATSNMSPDELYKNGLQRQHFLPVIAQLKAQLHITHLPSLIDYRLRHLKHAGVFYIPNDEAAQDNMEKSFRMLAGDTVISEAALDICGRHIPTKKRTQEVVWFDFKTLCGVPRSQQDYLVIAEKFNTVFLSDIPQISPASKDKISLFIRLIDVLYDARVRLVLSAETAVENIYQQGQMVFEYQRACSRLREMQSENYFGESA